MTVEGAVAGTPAYMPPEQAEGKLDLIDHRSDIYSLGAILYEILTLERPIEGQTVHQVLLNVSDGKIVPPQERTPDRQIPKELSAVTLKAMEKNRRKRYQSVQELAQDVKLFLEGRSVSAKDDSLAESLAKLVKRNKPVSMAAGVALTVLLVVASVFVIRLKVERDRAIESEKTAITERKAAVDARRKQLKTAREASETLARQAVRAAEEGRLEEARSRAEAAVKVLPDGPWGYYALGAIAVEGQDFDGARTQFEKALSFDRTHKLAQAALSQVLAAQGDLAEALEKLQKVDNLNDWRAISQVGRVLMSAGKYREAAKAYEKAVALVERVAEAPPGQVSELRNMLEKARVEVACEGFYESVRKLPPEELRTRVQEKFDEVHGEAIQMHVTVENGAVVGASAYYACPERLRWLQPFRGMPLESLSLVGARNLSDLGPLKGLPLKELDCSGTAVSDLSSLKGMPLVELNLVGTPVTDLVALKGMKLRRLNCQGDRGVRDLVPLRGMPLESLSIWGTDVSDLTPLEGMPLRELSLQGVKRVSDLGPLRGMPLESLNCSQTSVSNLTPLKGMPLRELACQSTGVHDLSPLAGMPLEKLNVSGARVTDLTPLKGMRLRSVHFRSQLTRGIAKGMEVLRSMESLGEIDGATPAEFRKWYDAQKRR